jgi:hypothetical protein
MRRGDADIRQRRGDYAEIAGPVVGSARMRHVRRVAIPGHGAQGASDEDYIDNLSEIAMVMVTNVANSYQETIF